MDGYSNPTLYSEAQKSKPRFSVKSRAPRAVVKDRKTRKAGPPAEKTRGRVGHPPLDLIRFQMSAFLGHDFPMSRFPLSRNCPASERMSFQLSSCSVEHFCCYEGFCWGNLFCMHVDPTFTALVTAIVSFPTAITSLVRTMLEKKLSKMTNSKLAFKKNGNRLTHTSVALFKKPSAEIKIIVPDWTRKQWESITSNNLVTLCAAHHG